MTDTKSRIRRQRSLSPHRAAETNPLNGTAPKRPSVFAIGKFLVPKMFQIKVHDKSVTAKRKFQVNVPTKTLVILGLVFIALPVSIFYYKEKHIHEHHEPHYKQQKFVNVDTKQALRHFKENQNNTSEMTSRDDPNDKNAVTSENTSRDDPPGESDMVNTTEIEEGQNAVKKESNSTKTDEDKR